MVRKSLKVNHTSLLKTEMRKFQLFKKKITIKCTFILFSCSLHVFLSSVFNNMLAAVSHNIKRANKTMYTEQGRCSCLVSSLLQKAIDLNSCKCK